MTLLKRRGEKKREKNDDGLPYSLFFSDVIVVSSMGLAKIPAAFQVCPE